MEANEHVIMKKFLYKILPFSLFVLLLILWQICASLFLKFNFLFGSPFDIFNILIENTLNGVLPYDFLITGYEAFARFCSRSCTRDSGRLCALVFSILQQRYSNHIL